MHTHTHIYTISRNHPLYIRNQAQQIQCVLLVLLRWPPNSSVCNTVHFCLQNKTSLQTRGLYTQTFNSVSMAQIEYMLQEGYWCFTHSSVTVLCIMLYSVFVSILWDARDFGYKMYGPYQGRTFTFWGSKLRKDEEVPKLRRFKYVIHHTLGTNVAQQTVTRSLCYC